MHENVHYSRNAEGLQYAIDQFRFLREEICPTMRADLSHRIFNYEWEEAHRSTLYGGSRRNDCSISLGK